MDNLLAVTFEAHNMELNHHRRYEIRVGRDLFGDWTVAFRYGRSGTFGRETFHANSDTAPLCRMISNTLRRRLSAPKRIGCRYEITELTSADEAIATAWLPSDTLSDFQASNRKSVF